MRPLMPDMALARRIGPIYNHLQLREGSPLTQLQREMVAVAASGLPPDEVPAGATTPEARAD